jgi:cysteine desulfurase
VGSGPRHPPGYAGAGTGASAGAGDGGPAGAGDGAGDGGPAGAGDGGYGEGHVAAYLDAASTEPLHPVARETLLAALDSGWADPTRLYREARRARLLLDNAREVVAALVGGGARPDEVSFTGSGTQAVHLGVLGVLAGRARVGARLVTTAVEHSCVLHAGAWHERAGGSVQRVGVDRQGVLDLDAFGAALAGGADGVGAGGVGVAGGVALAAVQSANHEVGTLQPLEQVASACAAGGVPLLVDAAQSLGRVPVPAGWSALTGSAHKWGGPAGVGVLVVRRGTRYRSVLPDEQRGLGLVPGFGDVPGALAAAAALQARLREAEGLAARHSAWVERVRASVPRLVPDTEVVGHPTQRLPHLVTFSCLYVDGEALLTALDREGLAVSSGSSCTSSTLSPSHVLEAMGVLTHGNVRVSFGRDTTQADVDRLLEVLPRVVAEVRGALGATGL